MREYIVQEVSSPVGTEKETTGVEIKREVIGELIRCKDCKHRPIETFNGIIPPKEDDWKCPCLCDDYFYSWMPGDDFFCANGERKER